MNIKTFFAGKLRKFILIAFDCLCLILVSLTYYFANLFFSKPIEYEPTKFIANVAILLLIVLVARFALGVYNSILSYTRTLNYVKLILADAVAYFGACIISVICSTFDGVWFFVVVASINLLITVFSRMVYRLLYKI